MARIYNSEVTKELAKTAGIQQNVDRVPTELAEKIVPTFETNPNALIKCNVVSSQFIHSPGTGTVYTTPKDKDFYLCSASVCFSADATSDVGAIYLDCVPLGQGRRRIFQFNHIEGVSSKDDASLSFPPILLEQGSTIQINQVYTKGNSKISGTIIGYTINNPRI